MIHLAKEANRSSKLTSPCRICFISHTRTTPLMWLSYPTRCTFVPQPEKALAEACRVLKDEGCSLPPLSPMGTIHCGGRFNPFSMRLSGFPLRSRWTCEEYLAFLRQCGWRVRTSRVLPASFPLTYAECIKSEV